MNKKPKYIDILEEEFATSLGAKPISYQEKLTLFIAHEDRDQQAIFDIEEWIQKAERLLSGIGGGATSQEARGAWVGEDNQTAHERTTLVYTYASPEKIEESVFKIREFMYDYGRETRQYQVAVLLENHDGDWFFRISHLEYDE